MLSASLGSSPVCVCADTRPPYNRLKCVIDAQSRNAEQLSLISIDLNFSFLIIFIMALEAPASILIGLSFLHHSERREDFHTRKTAGDLKTNKC